MSPSVTGQDAVLKYELEVGDQGRVELNVPDLGTQHAVRLRHAEALLPRCPILDDGIEQLIEDAKQSASQLLAPGILEWLPNITEHFYGLQCEPA